MGMLKSVPVMCESHVGSNSHGQQLLRSGKYPTTAATRPDPTRPVRHHVLWRCGWRFGWRDSSWYGRRWMAVFSVYRVDMAGYIMMNLSCQRICRFVAILLTVSFEICTFWYYLFIPRPHLLSIRDCSACIHHGRRRPLLKDQPSSCAQMTKYVVV